MREGVSVSRAPSSSSHLRRQVAPGKQGRRSDTVYPGHAQSSATCFRPGPRGALRPTAGGLKALADTASMSSATAAVLITMEPCLDVSPAFTLCSWYYGPTFLGSWATRIAANSQWRRPERRAGGWDAMAADAGQDAPKGRPIPFVTLETEVALPDPPLVAGAVRCPSLPPLRRGRWGRGACAAPCRPRPVHGTCERRMQPDGAFPRAGSASRPNGNAACRPGPTRGKRGRAWCAALGNASTSTRRCSACAELS